MARLKGSLEFLLSSRSLLASASTAGPAQAAEVAHFIAEEHLSRRGICSHGLQEGTSGCRPSGLFGLLASAASTPSLGATALTRSRYFTSSAKPSLFEALKLQAPSNPFAPRKHRPAVQKLVLYRGRGMLLFRFIVRAKVFQLMGFLACAVFTSVILTSSNPDAMDLAAVGALAVGCVVTSYCVWYYSGRYVGEMSLLLPERRVVRFSVLDFWGNREDNDVHLEAVVAPWRNRSIAEVRVQARQALMPIDVAGDRQYYISVPHGHVLQKEVLQKILYGAPLVETTDVGTADVAAGADLQGTAGPPDKGELTPGPASGPQQAASGVSASEAGGTDDADQRKDGNVSAHRE